MGNPHSRPAAAVMLLALAAHGCGDNKTGKAPSGTGGGGENGGGGGSGGGDELPAALAEYRDGWEVTRFDGFTVDGVELWRVAVVGVADLSTASVVGIDGDGALVRGAALFTRSVDHPPDELAQRALAILMGSQGGEAIMPDDELSVVSAEEMALVEPPSVADGVLTLWTVRGEMHPDLVRATVDLGSGEVEYELASDILHPPPDPLPPIRALLGSDDVDEIKEGVQKVSEYEALAPDVVALIDHPDATIRNMALGVLGNLGVPETVAPVVTLMKTHEDWGTRSRAAQTLLRIATDEAVAAVRAYAKTATGHEAAAIRSALERFDRNE